MDLSKFIDSKTFYTGIAVMIAGTLIIALGGYAWKKRQSLLSKFKSTRLFLFLLKVKEAYLEICQRIFQNHKVNETQQSLPDYIRSFGSWKSKSGDGITFSIMVDSETRIYNDVTDVRAYRIDPFSQLLYGLDIEYKKPGYDSYSESIWGIRRTEIVKIAKKCYFQELKERQNNETFTDN